MFTRTFLIISYHNLPKSRFITMKKIYHRFPCVSSQVLNRNFTVHTIHNHRSYVPVLDTNCIRHKNEFISKNLYSTSSNLSEKNSLNLDSVQMENVVMKIPEPPLPVQSEISVNLTEPSLHSLGLGSWYPSGLIQQFLELLHVNAYMPWWATIVIATVCVKLLMFPLNVKMQRHSAIMHNIQPRLQHIQCQVTEARRMGDQLRAYQLLHELKALMANSGTNPLHAFMLPFVQAPVFLSFYYGLRGMVNVPVESLKYGGLWWFENLTVPDKYYLLPILTSITLSLTFELGSDTMKLQAMGAMRYFLRCLPIIMFPFIINFEGAILCYWLTSNTLSLIQVLVLRIPAVRTYFQISPLEVHDKKMLAALEKKSFNKGFRESWTNIKMVRELGSRQMYDESVFEKAGKGPVPKTYKSNPLKFKDNQLAFSKKQRNSAKN